MNWGRKDIKMGCSATWSQDPGPELPLLLLVTPHLVCPGCTYCVLHPFACCFSRRWEGLTSCVS